ncbi:MAG: outer membrane protein assembly factor BamB [SAR86 cluster bacterium]|jgi:outer membrane protein assembly factor BamB|uniref:Outer membrane protein assembly factor BamB n=1 Tax=SAR86 cluster bacterium TaxID=2030880 RepID=A0A520N247_9GAMM|nr:MAG: outer membrane protein assembly factor BamB [Gammaproteobacteria bacterium TMED225]RZO27540.1 MAG: outer membrane protein assembly factor BamB [SAR86 cluster bacterium]|tara:strand:- start:5431 stop:6585 length:1155 start_codon:yes stop_codon:yes gene_type:complete
MNFLNKYTLILLVFLTSSCSSLDSLRFWQSDEIDPDEPKILSSFSNQKTITIAWKKSFKGENKMGNFQPDFSSQNLFFSDITGNVVSINSETGIENWSSKLNFLASGTAAGFGIVIVSDIEGNVIALNQNDGSQLWTSNVKGEVLTKAAIDAKIVVVKTGSGGLIGLEKETGNIQWSYRSKLPLLTVRGNSSPIIVEDRIYASFDNGRLAVFEIDSGFPIWDGAISYVSGVSELENLIDSDSDPVVDGGLVYTTNYQGNLNIFDVAQKRSVWSYETSSFYSPIITRGMLMVIEADSQIKSFSLKTLEESWINDDYLNRSLSNAVTYKGNIVTGDYEGYLHIIDPLNGKTIGRKKISRNPIKTIYSRSDSLYVIDEAFNLFSANL